MKDAVTVLGIDVAKQKVDVALFKEENKHQAESFKNTLRGHQKLWQWLKKHKATDCFACLEATGPYGEKLAVFLHEKSVKVSVVNPARVKGFRQSELGRTKTDEADAALIARFCRAMQPALWQPPAPHLKTLQALVRRLEQAGKSKRLILRAVMRKLIHLIYGVLKSGQAFNPKALETHS